MKRSLMNFSTKSSNQDGKELENTKAARFEDNGCHSIIS